MERQGLESDPTPEWGPQEPDTGLEEPMWQLGLGEGGVGDVTYPERTGEADCKYYLRTGLCGYGSRCRFNHPTNRSSVVGVIRAAGCGFPERVDQPVCQYYMRTGKCKFGVSCKYDHPGEGGESATAMSINISGYPSRPGEKECPYYVKTGQCKFGLTCKFDHPQPAGIQVQVPRVGPLPLVTPVPATIYPTILSPQALLSQQYEAVAGNWPVPNPTLFPGSYVQGAYSPMLIPQGMVPLSGWNPYQAPLSQVGSPSTQSTVGAAPFYGITPFSVSAPAYAGAYLPLPLTTGPSSSSTKEQKFPERPGRAECQYYMKTGDCKFGLSCRYHHPLDWNPPQLSFTLSPFGFPLCPGEPLCEQYTQSGMFKFGQACNFDHRMGTLTYSPSAYSLADMTMAPYPMGTSLGTLAPSSSSSDLRSSEKDTLSSSVSMPSGSIGSIRTQSGPASRPSVHQPGQASISSTTSNVHTSS